MPRILTTLLLAVVALAGCTSATEPDDASREHGEHAEGDAHAEHDDYGQHLYSADIARAQDAVTTEFETDVLADGVITDDEYAQAQELLLACVAEQGYTATHAGMGAYDVDGPDAAEGQTVLAGCAEGTTAALDPIYWGMKLNPERRNSADLIVECLAAAGLVEDHFTGEDFARTFEDPPFDAEDPAAVECMSAPAQS